jgi:hypothetical protein
VGRCSGAGENQEFVAQGGGFIGIFEPTAFENQGAYFQLGDVLGVQREVGLTLNNRAKLKLENTESHFILMIAAIPLNRKLTLKMYILLIQD